MQNTQTSCAWYLPWSLAAQQHQQKIMQIQSPFLDKMGASTVGGIFATQPQVQQQLSPNTAAAPPSNYQQPTLHPSAAAGTHFPMSSAYNFGPTLLSATQVASYPGQLNPCPQSHPHSHTQTHLMPSSMFSSLPVGAYYAPAPGVSVAPQESLLATAGQGLTHQTSSLSMPVQAAPRASSSACAIVQSLNCLPPDFHHLSSINLNMSSVIGLRNQGSALSSIKVVPNVEMLINKKITSTREVENEKVKIPEKRKTDNSDTIKDLKKAKLETKALKAKRPGFTDERYQETSYYIENGLRKVYPYYFTFTTFTKGRWVGEKILDIFSREFRAHPSEEYERCIQAGTLTVNFEKVPIDYRLKHNDLLANIVHRHEVPVTCQPIKIVHMNEDLVVVNKPASIPVHPCGRYRHNTVVFILAKEFNLKNLRTIHRLDRLTSGLLLFGRSPKKARQMEQQIRNRQVEKEYICRVEGIFPDEIVECKEPIEVVSYKIGVCKVSQRGKDCTTTFQKISQNGKTSVVLCKPLTGRMHQIRVHLQYLGYPILNDPLYNHEVFGPLKGRFGDIGGKSDDELIRDLINIHNAENWLGIDYDSDISIFKSSKDETDGESLSSDQTFVVQHSDDDVGLNSRETTPPCIEPSRAEVVAKKLEPPNFPKEFSCTDPKDPTEISSVLQAPDTILAVDGGNVDVGVKLNKITTDPHCYECKVHYRDPKSKDLIMYLHAWKYKGPGWEYETEFPVWARTNWENSECT
ncbi:RNA pseudouridylate synthase domain-containing protein 2-like isoform X1 [Drosophila pseudoobscura]|uniref:Pseudouridylate synthase RPUSD2 n=1 Tax=Drosophila pseudoobscura pseudoobscura TaxID=46245 RepID=A0A6I8VXY1_DROPS|nr:RNA pseudouridylate synthase domain-containing protein 2 isoform X1 [Drosophila pseudoobscura]XP_033235911.1 RNA pseudouridylate synthase domain-containing protein 2 isoform X1 [Drosophila pseudoobscura]XP_033235912.1 RNA pseudouridylate synthase domain-containing protein 2 isoform X1 [Drosophila pseudoobscura]